MATKRTTRLKTKRQANARKAAVATPSSPKLRRWFYQKNKKLLEHKVNKTFEEILWMSDRDFKQWVKDLRAVVVELWDKEDAPPRNGLDEEDIVRQFEHIAAYPISDFLKPVIGKTKQLAIVNSTSIGSAANQWFPTMMKTKINDSEDIGDGVSIYDFFSRDELFERMVTYCRRHFKRDSFYHYSFCVTKESKNTNRHLFSCATGRDWILRFERNATSLRDSYDYWLEPITSDRTYTGYSDTLRSLKYITITKKQLVNLPIPQKCKVNVSSNRKADRFRLRVFEKGQKLFPVGFKAFRVSYCQSAVNFPPLTAKFIYERHLEKLRVNEAIIWDPSAGWGGRIVGALGVSKRYRIHYIGTDPNTDHNTENGRTKYHELADFYNEVRTGVRRSRNRKRRATPITNTYEIFQCGSEVMHKKRAFQKYKGNVDIVFTSPPYFSKELYSDDKEQSARKFDEYAAWRDGFLERTLTTAVQWLKPGGFLVWNIANIKLRGKSLPLENDTCRILEKLGMERIEVLKMALAQMPGGNRVDMSDVAVTEETLNNSFGIEVVRNKRGKIKAPHGCWLVGESGKEVAVKYEPIFVYRKPSKRSNKAANSAKAISDYALVVSKMTREFKKAITAERINPNLLRAIYEELERRIAGDKKSKHLKSYNSGKRREFFVTEKTVDGKLGAVQFVQRRIANHSFNKLAGEEVLVQFCRKRRGGKTERLFSFGELQKPEVGDDERMAYVKISNNKSRAEKYCGLMIRCRRWDILKVPYPHSRFVTKQANWDFK